MHRVQRELGLPSPPQYQLLKSLNAAPAVLLRFDVNTEGTVCTVAFSQFSLLNSLQFPLFEQTS